MVSDDDMRQGHGPRHATVEDRHEVPAALRNLGLRLGRPVLVCVGGAGGMTPEHLDAMASLLRERVVPALDRWGAAVADGGTDSGVMRVMGEARHAAGATFALVGVAARGTVTVPGENRSGSDTVDLEQHHTQVLLVPGHTWGDESPWLSHVATVIAGGHPSATLVVNGGEITYNDIAHAVTAGRPVIVVAGTGRTADAIASAAAGQTTGDPVNERAARLAASPLLRIVRLDDPDGLTTTIESVLAPQP
jgi:SLOG in TRPM, prokaryote